MSVLCDVTEELCPHPRGGEVEPNVNTQGAGAFVVGSPYRSILCNASSGSLAIVHHLLARV